MHSKLSWGVAIAQPILYLVWAWLWSYALHHDALTPGWGMTLDHVRNMAYLFEIGGLGFAALTAFLPIAMLVETRR